ncbi:MAG: hypothetical protein VB957_14945 [Pseudomonadales bacterium]
MELLDGAFLMSGSARKGRFSLFMDIVYLSMSGSDDGKVVSVESDANVSIPVGAELNLSTKSDLDGLVWTFAAG